MIEHRSHIHGVVGEFETEHQLLHAVEKTREAGYRRVEAYTPFPVEGLSEALGLKRNTVPFDYSDRRSMRRPWRLFLSVLGQRDLLSTEHRRAALE